MFSTQRKPPLLSFHPQNNRTKYEHIPPGIYIFVQDKNTQQVFLWNSNSGHGHAFFANMVNKLLGRAVDDFAWIGAAGELVYGDEILGLSPRTGFFHQELALTEPQPQIPDYEVNLLAHTYRIQQRLEACFLPAERYYSVRDWEDIIFNKDNRAFFFTESGLFQTTSAEQIHQFRQQLRWSNPHKPHSENILQLFKQLLQTLEDLLPQENTRGNKAVFFAPAHQAATPAGICSTIAFPKAEQLTWVEPSNRRAKS